MAEPRGGHAAHAAAETRDPTSVNAGVVPGRADRMTYIAKNVHTAEAARSSAGASQGRRTCAGRSEGSTATEGSSFSDWSTNSRSDSAPSAPSPNAGRTPRANSFTDEVRSDVVGDRARSRAASASGARLGSSFEMGGLGPRKIASSEPLGVAEAKGLLAVSACQVTTASEKTSVRSSTRRP